MTKHVQPLKFIRSPIRKEWEIQRDGRCIGHIWFWANGPKESPYCLRIGNDGDTTYHCTVGQAREAATRELVDAEGGAIHTIQSPPGAPSIRRHA